MTEYTMSVNSFNRPKELTGNDAIYTLLVRLFLLDPGTNQSFPNMGLGARKRYRYSFQEDIVKLESEFKDQINTYLPSLNLVDIKAKLVDKTLLVQAQINSTVFEINFNTETKTIEEL